MTRRLNTDIHVGVAVDTDDGLIVPVLRNAQSLDLAAISEELTRLTMEARTRRIAPEALRGATISLSNFGALGGLFATLVVVPPQVAILGAGRIHPTCHSLSTASSSRSRCCRCRSPSIIAWSRAVRPRAFSLRSRPRSRRAS